eukprot:gene4291-5366_t
MIFKLFILFLFINCIILGCYSQSTSTVRYQFTVPYVGGHELTIENTGSSSITIQKLFMVSNVLFSSTPYGQMWNNAATYSVKRNDNVTYAYTITWGSSGFSLSAGESSSFTYTYTDTLGPLNGLGMNPRSVSVSLSSNPNNPITATIAGACKGSACNNPSSKRITGYYTDWDMYSRQFLPEDIPIDIINNIHYAFLNFDNSGNIMLYDTNSDPQQLPRLSVLRQQYPYLNIYLSIGGWTLSGDFSTVASNSESTQNFANQCAQALLQTGMNGIDIDWEYPVDREGHPDDAQDFPAFLMTIRKAIDEAADQESQRTGTPVKFYLSVAAAAGIDKVQAITNLNPDAYETVVAALDVVNIMAYDYHGCWDPISDFMAPFNISPIDPWINNSTISQYNMVDSVKLYLGLGFSPSQISVGIPAYGRAVLVSQMGNSQGLYQPIVNCATGEFDDTGIFDYRCIIANECYGSSLPAGTTLLSAPQNPFALYSQEGIGYNKQTGFFITYDDSNSATVKSQYVLDHQLGGAMVWTISGDTPSSNPNSIFSAIHKVFTSGE